MAAVARETSALLTRVPPELKAAVVESARLNHRSVARELEHALARMYALDEQQRQVTPVPA